MSFFHEIKRHRRTSLMDFMIHKLPSTNCGQMCKCNQLGTCTILSPSQRFIIGDKKRGNNVNIHENWSIREGVQNITKFSKNK